MKLGTIATGDDFFDRKSECADLWRYLEGDHVVASGPRRLGKSSIVNQLIEEAKAQGLLARHVDVQGVEGAQAFINQLSGHFPEESIKGYLKTIGQVTSQWLSKVKKVEFKGPAGIGGAIELQATASQSWQASAIALQARLTDVPALIFIDEFSVFLQKLLETDRKEAEALLAWLRAWRVKPAVACRFLFTGSIGLNALLEKYGLSAQFNDCYEYPIGPFKPNVARDMLTQFAKRDAWLIDTTSTTYLCDRIGWLSPFYLCLLLDETMKAARDRLDETTTTLPTVPARQLLNEDIDTAYERLLSGRSRFKHWEERLERDLSPPDLAFVKLMLTALAKSKAGLTQKQLQARLAKLEADPDTRLARQQTLLIKLQEEGYTTPPDETGRIQFLSFLLRDFWGRNHV